MDSELERVNRQLLEREEHKPTPYQMIAFCLMSGADAVLLITYTDSKRRTTRRKVSPIRWNDDHSQILCLCLARETPRWFKVASISEAHQVDANSVLMPEQIEVLE